MRRSLLVVLVAAIALPHLPAAGETGGTSDDTPAGQILVVTANLEEAWSNPQGLTGGTNTNDLDNMEEIRVFANRLLDQAPYLPDALLLQEVNRRSSAYVAKVLSNKTGVRFVTAVRPTRRTSITKGGRQIHTETAIVLNAETMKTVSSGGYLKSTYDRSAAAPGERIQIKKQAYMLAAERATGERFPLVSVHYVPTKQMSGKSAANRWRGRWSRQIVSLIGRKYPSARSRSSVAGDFNAVRCYSGSFASCNEAAFWDTFVTKSGYIDSTRDAGIDSAVDYIFAKTELVRAGWDEGGKVRMNSPRFYSNHRFRWSLLSAP